MTLGDDSMEAMTAMPDCCDTDQALSGPADEAQPHPCKVGQECKVNSSSAVAPASLGTQPLFVVQQAVFMSPIPLIPSRDPLGLWRPPRAL